MMQSTKKNNKGQVLPLTLGFLLAVLSVVFYMFNTGQVVQEKMRLTNTADAVAYSAGVYEARVLNYDAYTNRAMIANEIAIGHAMGMASWAKYSVTFADNIDDYIRYIPYVGEYIYQALQEYKEIALAALDVFSVVAVAPNDAAIQALRLSQFAVHGPGNSVALINRQRVMVEVARRNDPDVTVDVLPIGDDFRGFTQFYQGDGRARMREVVERTRQQDDFLNERNWDFSFGACPFKLEIKKVGGTGLVGYDGWKSIDTISTHITKLKRGRCKTKENAWGFGSSFSADGLDNDYDAFGVSEGTNPKATDRALDGGDTGGLAWDDAPPSMNGGEIPSHWGLSQAALNQDDPRTQIAIMVRKTANRQRYSGGVSAVRPAGRLQLYEGDFHRDESRSIARAEVFFERPDGGNAGNAELGSLFNPYWQVRLVSVTAADKAQGIARP
jgi:hypothetical protein